MSRLVVIAALLLFACTLTSATGVADVRARILAWARWGVAHHREFHYAQVRPIQYSPSLPWRGDCSGFVTFCYKHAGAADPNGNNYNGQGYTGTLLAHGRKIAKSQLQPGDIVIYGMPTVHTAIVIQPGADPLTISMGHEGAPNLVTVNQDGRHPQFFVTCEGFWCASLWFFLLNNNKQST